MSREKNALMRGWEIPESRIPKDNQDIRGSHIDRAAASQDSTGKQTP